MLIFLLAQCFYVLPGYPGVPSREPSCMRSSFSVFNQRKPPTVTVCHSPQEPKQGVQEKSSPRHASSQRAGIRKTRFSPKSLLRPVHLARNAVVLRRICFCSGMSTTTVDPAVHFIERMSWRASTFVPRLSIMKPVTGTMTFLCGLLLSLLNSYAGTVYISSFLFSLTPPLPCPPSFSLSSVYSAFIELAGAKLEIHLKFSLAAPCCVGMTHYFTLGQTVRIHKYK